VEDGSISGSQRGAGEEGAVCGVRRADCVERALDAPEIGER
jgi:hypothetical protein